MISIQRIQELLDRLWSASCRNGEWNSELWRRGLEKLQDKYSFTMYLSKFEPSDMIEDSDDTQRGFKLTITPQ